MQACRDPKVFGPFFRGQHLGHVVCLPGGAVRAADDAGAVSRSTRSTPGARAPPTNPLHEAWLVCGRRSGKIFILAVIAIFLASFTDWRPFLGPGEVGTIMIIAADRRQARTIMRYCLGLLQSRADAQATDRGRDAREHHSCAIASSSRSTRRSFRTTRGYTCVAALLDEVAYWPS